MGTASSNKYGSRGQSCVVMCDRARSYAVVRAFGHAWSCLCGRSCVVVRGRARSCVVVRGHARSVVRGRSFVVVRGRV